LSKQVTIGSNTFILNQSGDNPPWGEELSDLLQALVDAANDTLGPNDIAKTKFELSNNVTTPTNISALNFDITQVRSAVIEYSIYRTSDSQELSECGTMLITYKSIAGTWEVARYGVGDAGVEITITSVGQAQYKSTDIGTNPTGLLTFKARAYEQN
jgi:hypothetical protein